MLISIAKRSKLTKLIVLLAVCAMIVPLLVASNVKAATSAMMPELEMVSVNDLDTATFPSTYRTFGSYVKSNAGYELVFPMDMTNKGAGTVKIWFDITKSLKGYGTVRVTDNYSISNSITGYKQVTPEKNSITTWLEGGKKYYVVFSWDDLGDSEIASNSDIGVAALYEYGASEENLYNSIQTAPTQLVEGKTCKGFIGFNDTDYYSFTVKDNSAVKITYSMDGKRNLSDENSSGMITIYDETLVSVIKSIQVNTKDANYYNVAEFDLGTLENGTYIVGMSGIYGRTTLKYSSTSYNITFEPEKNADGVNVIAVKTDFDVAEIRCLNCDVSPMNIDNSETWNSSNQNWVEMENGNKFKTIKGGTYTVRVTDKASNKNYTAVYNTGLNDLQAPVVSGIEDGKAYKSGRKINFSDSNGGIAKAELNGKSVISGVRVCEQGNYELVVIDESGNKTVVTFVIDYEAPILRGFKNGEVYTEGGKFFWHDQQTKVESVVVEIGSETFNLDLASKDSYSCESKGKYTAYITDSAGNVTRSSFTVE